MQSEELWRGGGSEPGLGLGATGSRGLKNEKTTGLQDCGTTGLRNSRAEVNRLQTRWPQGKRVAVAIDCYGMEGQRDDRTIELPDERTKGRRDQGTEGRRDYWITGLRKHRLTGLRNGRVPRSVGEPKSRACGTQMALSS